MMIWPLGAIDAIDRAGILPGMIKIVGIDATPPGMEALKAGKLFGTVAADKEGYANAIFPDRSLFKQEASC